MSQAQVPFGDHHSSILDHVAVAVPTWEDGFAPFISDLGGRWFSGGDVGEFAPCQLSFQDDMKIELLRPGSDGAGFVNRFLERSGPGPHHVTFHVPDIEAFVAGCTDLGYGIMPGVLDLPGRRECFVHPKETGFGTLLQAIETAERNASPPPAGWPEPTAPQCAFVWAALVVPSVASAIELFDGVLAGRVSEARGDEWALVEWNPSRRLLLVAASGERRPGIHHLLFADAGQAIPDPADVLARPPPDPHPTTGVSIILPARVGPQDRRAEGD